MIHKIQTNTASTSKETITNFASRLCLDHKGINDMYQLVNEIKNRLIPFKLKEDAVVNRIGLSVHHKNLILKVCITGAFYPNYFLRASCISSEEQERQMFHELNGQDPTSTIYYRGIGKEDLGMLYETQVKNFLKEKNVIKSKDDVEITFDEGSQKMYVTFCDTKETLSEKHMTDFLPGKIKPQIYKAIKLARERQVLRLKVLAENDMSEYKKYQEPWKPKPFSEKLCVIPRLKDHKIDGIITHVKNPNKFWIFPQTKEHVRVMNAIQKVLIETPLYPVHNFDEIVGRKVIVEIQGNPYRARVESVMTGKNGIKFKVFLFDEGSEENVVASQLMSIDDVMIDGNALGLDTDVKIKLIDVPPRVFEASLTEIRPSYLASLCGKWTPEAIQKFSEFADAHEGSIEIYSVWNGIASVILHNKQGKTINEELVELQLAESCEENYSSKYDHALRYQTQNFLPEETNETYREIEDCLKKFDFEPIKPPPEQICVRNVTLRGPFSPLETTIHSTVRALANSSLALERDSVNSVLLDTDSSDPTDRLIVAASCGCNTSGTTYLLRNTTVMPNIQGFPSLMAMLFAPMVELHPDTKKTRYNSILCGLGYNPKTNQGYFEGHDVTINLDCVIDQDDLRQINKIRSTMSDLLYTDEGENAPNITQKTVRNLQKTLILDLIKYLEKPRQLIDMQSHCTVDSKWNDVSQATLLKVFGTDIYQEKAAFPAFTFTELRNETQKEIEELRQNNEDLHQIAFCNKYMRSEVKCRLCSTILTSVPEIQIHLFRKLHKDRVKYIEDVLKG